MTELEFTSDIDVELLDFMGSDITIVNNARQSFGQHSSEMDTAAVKLIGFLMRNRHGTPFEAVEFCFQVRCPIFVAREWFRHRIGSFNEFSGRYKQLPPKFYVPEVEDVRSQRGKPGAYTFEQAPIELAEVTRTGLVSSYTRAYAMYDALLSDGIAKEQARLVLPVAIFTEFTWKTNARSLMNFLSLRLAENAMLEIRRAANVVDAAFCGVAPATWHAFHDLGRVAP